VRTSISPAWLFVSALAAAAAVSCGGPQFAGGDPTGIILPGPKGGDGHLAAPTSEPEDLPGVDTSKLVPRERAQWWKLVSQLYAPCAEQAVSIAQCVKEARACAACPAAARLLASRVQTGATAGECESVYAARFGPNLKQADLRGAPSRGPDDAPVTIAVWSDFGCPHCKLAMPILEDELEKRAPSVRLVHKFYPLGQNAQSFAAATAAIAAQAQGKYWEMEALLFGDQRAHAESDLVKDADALKLDMKRFKADMSSDRAKATIARDKAEADKAGLSGTPFILINGRVFDTILFSLDTELDEWVSLEIELASGAKPQEKKTEVAAPP
jgi:thioredoxin family protein